MPEQKTNGASRREFLGAAAAAGATLALAPHLESAAAPATELRTLFFNFSHEDYEGHTYYLVMGKNRYLLAPASASSQALASARQTNRFVQALPTTAITHVLANVQLPANAVQLSYTIKNPNTTTGTWDMSNMYLYVPQTSVSYAYAMASKGLLAGDSLPLSAKRMKYGLTAATSLQDVFDEQDVVDSTDWAKAMVNVHPEMLSADPNSASHIQNNLISARDTFQLSQQLEAAGPATPQQFATANNSGGWATLVPYTDDDGVTPLKNTTGNNKGLILYNAQWQPSINTFVAGAMKPTSSAVKNDTTLGTDVSAGAESLSATNLTGVIWCRNDGITSVTQSPVAAGALESTPGVNYALSNITPNFNGYSLDANTSVSGDTVTVTLNFTNWYLRWLGLFIQFYDANGKVVPKSKLPPGIGDNNAFGLDTQNSEVFIGTITPEFTIFGIPVQASKNAVTFPFPTSVASSANILASGLGLGSHTHQDTEFFGIVMTSVFNLSLPALLIAFAIGAQVDVCIKTVVIPSVNGALIEFFNSAAGGTAAQFATIFWRALVKGLLNPAGPLKSLLESLAAFLAEAEVTTAFEDAIPIVGAILQAIGALGAEAEIAETACEVVLSPWTYAYSLVGTHDLNVTLNPDPGDKGGFPAAAATYTVTAIFDNGTPHVQNLKMPGETVKTLPPVVFQGVPLGGNVTVSVAFYTTDGTLVGHGSVTGSNDVSAAPSITITEVQLPITSATIYHHKQKTTLDAQGNHVWACAAAPPVPSAPSFCQSNPGNLCSFRNITVSSLGYLGYGWQSYSTDSCNPGGAGQLDQMANIFISNGSGGNAQNGYAFTPCAIEPGTKLVYDPLGRPGLNYYLDTTNNQNLVRQVQLMPPSFANPHENNAWGKFNLNPDDVLLHPAGALVSINSENSRMESLHLPAAPVSDAEAGVSLLANLHGGLGTRPGLFDAPTVTTITSDGVILILESGNNRIHAVDLASNAVRHFTKQPTPYFLNFSETGGAGTQYLDIAVEFSGLIYVLSSSNSVYRLDIYDPNQTGTNPLSTTMGFNAAKVTVDYWRNVYSLNYEVLKLPNGSLPSNGVTEPSVSQWIPAVPQACDANSSAWRTPVMRQPLLAVNPRRLLRRRDFWGAWGRLV